MGFMQIDQTKSIEKQIGAEISRVRKIRKLTQRQFADALSLAGMNVDATAVSRLEKGERSLRIAECVIIADVLRMGIESLLRGVQTPAQRMRETIREADLAIASAQQNLWTWLAHHYDAKLTLERLPELLKAFTPELQSPEDYLPMVAGQLAAYDFSDVAKVSEGQLGVRDEGDKSQLMDCVIAYFDHLISINPNFPFESAEDLLKWKKQNGVD